MSFSNLIYLSLLLALPILALAYRHQVPKNLKRVSSVLIYKLLPLKTVVKQKIKLPPRFWLEIFLLSLLVFALLGPKVTNLQKKTIVLLDNSLSMSAVNESSKTRLQLAKDEIIKIAPPGNFKLCKTSPEFECIIDNASQSVMRSKFAEIDFERAPDNLSSALSELSKQHGVEKIIVATDKKASNTSATKSKFQVLYVGEVQKNFYIKDILINNQYLDILVSYSSSPNDKNISTKVKLSRLPLTDELKNEFAKTTANMENKNWQEVEAKNIQINGNTENVARFGVKMDNAFIYRAEISAENLGKPVDAIASDNIAYFTLASLNTNEILVVSSKTSNNYLGLDGLTQFNFKIITPEEFKNISADNLTKKLMLIFHQSAPEFATRVPTLLILPPINNPFFPLKIMNKGEALVINSPKITSFDNLHSINLYLNFNLLKPKNSFVFEKPLWAQDIIKVEDGTLLVAGESNGVRYAGVGFELLPFGGARSSFSSVLFLNLLNWLGGTQAIQNATIGDATESNTFEVQNFYIPDNKDEYPMLDNLSDEQASTIWQYLIWVVLLILFFDWFWMLIKK